MAEREQFASRIGFILITAGCAIGLGNVWRFPFIAGKYGGGAFVLLYLFFLVILGVPVMTMELSVGRASQRSSVESFRILEGEGSKWHLFGYPFIIGNYILMMFYTTVTGWMLYYAWLHLRLLVTGATIANAGETFAALTADPWTNFFFMALSVLLCFAVVAKGLQKGVERITKGMMAGLFLLLLVLVVRILTLPGAGEGVAFYLKPDFSRMRAYAMDEVIFAAMGQAFFTLSIGMSAIAIFGSYIDRSHRLFGEALSITALDTTVAFLAGLIVIPAAFAFDVPVGAGPSLIFVTLPEVFRAMDGGNLWGLFFFVFMSFAAFSTVIAVFENITSFWIDAGKARKPVVRANAAALILLAIPCILGFNLWSGFEPLGPGTNVLDLEDFIISNNILPLGSIVYILFCTRKKSWGYEEFVEEVNAGKGAKLPKALYPYYRYVMPLIILWIWVRGILVLFG